MENPVKSPPKIPGKTIFYDKRSASQKQFRMMQLDKDLLNAIESGESLTIKGGLQEHAVVCSKDKTYSLKHVAISNTVLPTPCNNFKNPPANGADGRFNIHSPIMSYLECLEIRPRYRKAYDILAMTRYSGPEKECFIDRKLIFNKAQFIRTIQCSEKQLDVFLKEFRAIELDSTLRILDVDYEYRIISFMTALISENSWQINEIDKQQTIDSLDGLAPQQIVHSLFDIYTQPNDHNSKYTYREDLICKIIARNILQNGLKFGIEDFFSTWHDSVPEGIMPEENYLRGIAVIDRDTNPPCVRAIDEQYLPIELKDRLIYLFKTKPEWRFEQIEPYIDYFTTPILSATALLTKFTRTIVKDNERIYVAKHQ